MKETTISAARQCTPHIVVLALTSSLSRYIGDEVA